ncbi:PDZ domain-containing protein [Trichonephila clavata]|uniref:PDZ domain-containing protein n=1 Tax=Trichonephila clavata TaxID=2740835 RepID=A0A8X6KXE9_TRICU|nr:PDZ domain-containing protein [Trichonephila clavata]
MRQEYLRLILLDSKKNKQVNPGSKAYHQGLLEGDFLKMVNGYFTDGLSQMDVQNIIKETGTHLTLEVERNSVQPDIEKMYTARTTITLNGSPNHSKRDESSSQNVYPFFSCDVLRLKAFDISGICPEPSSEKRKPNGRR